MSEERCAFKRRLIEILGKVPGSALGRHFLNGKTQPFSGDPEILWPVPTAYKWGGELVGEGHEPILVVWHREPNQIKIWGTRQLLAGAMLSNPHLASLRNRYNEDKKDAAICINPDSPNLEQELLEAIATVKERNGS